MVPVWCRNVGMRERLGLLLKQRRLSQDDVKAVLQVQLYTFLFRHCLHLINLCFVIQVVIFPRLESNNASDCKPITYILLKLWYQYMSCTWWWSHYQDFFWFIIFGSTQEYHDNIGDTEGAEEREKRRGKIQKLLSAMWGDLLKSFLTCPVI